MMLNDLNRLELTAKDIELIEAALHTQKKILAVQSEAGGTGARRKLTDLKHLIKRVRRTRPVTLRDEQGWFASARNYFFSTGCCSQLR